MLSVKKILAYAWPLFVILTLVFTYVTAPHFYVSYIFQIEERELQLVEILTFLAAGMAGGLLIISTILFRTRMAVLLGGFLIRLITSHTI